MSCELAHDDAAYVLGSLSPAERAAYQRHLAGCEECTRSVRSLAGIPGLLARIPADVLESPRPAEPVPDTVLPALVDEVRRRQRRRTWAVSAAAAAAAAVVTAGTVVLGDVVGGDGAATPAGPSVTASASPSDVATGTEEAAEVFTMYPTRDLPVTAEVALTSVDWGTRLNLTCAWDEVDAPSGGGQRSWDYALVVRTRDGRSEQVSSWEAHAGKTSRITAATSTPRDEIADVEIQNLDGETLLRTHT